MKPEAGCAQCILKWVYERAAASASEEERFQLVRSILTVLSTEFYSAANVGSLCNKVTDSVHQFMFDSAKYYEGLKLKSNRLVDGLLPAARDFVNGGETPGERFERACCLASASNVAPIGAPSDAFEFQEVANIMMGRSPLLIVRGDVYRAAQSAANVLYIADNAGEIGFDSLLIANLKEMGSRVTLVVKEAPYFDDATREDALHFTLDKLVDKILTTRGQLVPGESPSPLADAFRQSDLVIAKGTGNYGALKGETRGKAVIYMLKVKCAPIAAGFGSDMGQFVVALDE